MTRILTLAAWALALIATASGVVAQEPPPREIFIPQGDLPAVLAKNEFAFLNRDEYERLLADANIAAQSRPPVDHALLSAEYTGQIGVGRVGIEGTIEIDVLTDNLTRVPLALSGVGLSSATLGEQPATLAIDPALGPVALIAKKGKHSLKLVMTAPLVASAATQSLQLRLPRAGASRLTLVAPGNVEVKSGAPLIGRTVDAAADTTTLELDVPDGPMAVVVSLNNKRLAQDRVVVVRSVLIDELTQAYERLHAQASFGVLQGALDAMELRVPTGFDVTSVESPLVSRWSVADGVLKVELHEPATETVVVRIVATRMGAVPADWEFPQLAPRDVASHAAVLGLLLEDRLQPRTMTATALSSVDATVLLSAAPESVLAAAPGLPAIRPVVAFYAPHDLGRLKATFSTPKASTKIASSLILSVEERELSARVALSIVPKVDKRFALDFTAPAGWSVSSVAAHDGRPLTIERRPSADGGLKVSVAFAQGLAPDRAVDLLVDLKSVPKGWLDAWTEARLELPRLVVDDAEVAEGAVSLAPRDDLELRPDVIDGLATLTESERKAFDLSDNKGTLAYRHLGPLPLATFVATRKTPSLVARTYSFVTFEPGVLKGRYEIRYDAREAAVRKLAFSLPEQAPAEVSLRGLDGVEVKDSTRSTVAGRRRWEVELTQRRAGAIRLAVTFEIPLSEGDTRDVQAPLVQAEGVDFQTGFIAIEGHPELEIEIPVHPRTVDEGELYASDFPIGDRLVGAFGHSGDAEVRVDIARQTPRALPAALARQARFRTQISPTGKCQTESVHIVRCKAAFVEIELPPGATLWTVSIDGRASKPQKTRDRLVVSLPPSSTIVERELKIVYETAIAPALFAAGLRVDSPKLATRETPESDPIEIPVAGAEWELVLPAGYASRNSVGTVEPVAEDRYEPALWKLFRALKRMTVQPSLSVDLKGGYDVPASFGVNSYPVENTKSAPRSGAGLRVPTHKFEDGGDDLAFDATPMRARRDGMDAPNDESRPLERAEQLGQSGPESAAPPQAATPQTSTSQTASQALPPVAQTKKKNDLSLQGVAGLLIGVEGEPNSPLVRFASLGAAPRIEATLVHRGALTAVAVFVGALTLALALWFGRESGVRAIPLIVNVLWIATVAPAVFPALESFGEAFDGAFFGAAIAGTWLLVRYGIEGCWRSMGDHRARLAPKLAWFLGRTALVLIGACFVAEAAAQNPVPQQNPAARFVPGEVVPTRAPADAVIIPFDPDDVDGVAKAKIVWVPYAKYAAWLDAVKSRERADAVAAPVAPYGLSTSVYEAELGDADRLDLKGRVEIDVFSAEPVTIPFLFGGGALVDAKLDGKPAKLQVVAPGQPGAVGDRPLTLLTAVNKGRHQFEFVQRMGAIRQGGWRVVAGELPAPAGARLKLVATQGAVDVRLRGVADRELFETTPETPTIETALAAPGSVSIQWRPKLEQAIAERNVTAKSAAVFDVRQDVLRLSWSTTVEFPRSRRDALTFSFPKDYVVERIVGDNVRGWTTRENADDKTVDVTLLKEAVDRETVVIYLARYGAVGRDAMSTFFTPTIQAVGATLQQGTIAVRRDALLELRALEVRGVRREDAQLAPALAAQADSFDVSPLPLREHQTYSYSSLPVAVRFGAGGVLDEAEVESQVLLSVGERVSTIEARAVVTPRGRAVHRVDLLLPLDVGEIELDSPVEGGFEESIVDEGDRRRVTVFLVRGQSNPFPLTLVAKAPSPKNGELSIPRIAFIDVARQEGTLAVEVDPSYDLRIEPGASVEAVPASSAHDWVRGDRRERVRGALRWRANDYAARLRLTPRQPVVSSRILHNVRVGAQTLEQTIVVEFQISHAGVRELSFLLPEELAKARIRAPSLRRIERTKPQDPALSSYIHVRLELEDAFLGDYRVQVLHDEVHGASPRTVRLPILETAGVKRRYLILESAGRDEVAVDEVQSMEPLTREQQAFVELARMLGSRITQAYAAMEDKGESRLTLTLQAREAVATAGARIGLAETLLVADRSGAYRAKQTWRVDNTSEQQLEVELPPGAALWSTTVDGRPVKPATPKNAGASTVRIPIMRRAGGDADYEVALVYAGELPSLSWSGQTRFPFPRTVNIHVERSVVRLMLPKGFRWFAFDGMGEPVGEQAVQREMLGYLQKQVSVSLEALTGGEAFRRLSCENNLKQVGSTLESAFRSNAGVYQNDDELDALRRQNEQTVQEALKRLENEEREESSIAANDNRTGLSRYFDSQNARRDKGQGQVDARNFDAESLGGKGEGKGSGFNAEWFKGAKIPAAEGRGGEVDAEQADRAEQPMSRVSGARTRRPTTVAGKPANGEVQAGGQLGGRIRLNDGDSKEDATENGRQGKDLDERQQALSNYRRKLNNDFVQGQSRGVQTLDQSGSMGDAANASGPMAPNGAPGDSRTTVQAPTFNRELTANAGFTSLVVDIRAVGVEHRFVAARDISAITVRYVERSWIERLVGAGAALACLIGILVAIRYLVRVLANEKPTWIVAAILLALSFPLLVVGMPALAVVVLAVAVGYAARAYATATPQSERTAT